MSEFCEKSENCKMNETDGADVWGKIILMGTEKYYKSYLIERK